MTSICLDGKTNLWINHLKQFEYYRYYIVFGCTAVVENWVRGGMKESPEDMATIAKSFLPGEKIYLK